MNYLKNPRNNVNNFAIARQKMVETQIQSRGINDTKVLEVMRKVPRHFFVDPGLWDRAYGDYPLPIGEGQTISQPYMVALMTASLRLKGNEKLLEIGTGSGYQTAILAELVAEVYTIERIEKLAKSAEAVLHELGYRNIILKSGDGSLGWCEHAPFDRIIVTAGAPEIPSALFDQLSENGIMSVPIGDMYYQTLTIVEKSKGKPKISKLCGCVFVPLIGKYGWK